MRKIICLILVVVLVGVLLTSCAKIEVAPAEEEILTPVTEEEPEDVSEYEVEMVTEEEVDIGELI